MKYFLIFISTFILLISCQGEYYPDEGNNNNIGKTASVRIITRSATGSETVFPIHIFAFSSSGSLITQQLIYSSEEEFCISLPQEIESRIVAISANEEIYEIPENPTSSSIITMKKPTLDESASNFTKNISQGYTISHPIQMGWANICPTSDNAKVTLQLNFQVTSISVALRNLPSECSAAYLSISSTYTGISMDGTFSGQQTTRIPLSTSSSNQTWNSDEVFIFPSNGTQTNFTISFNDYDGEQCAAVNYKSQLVVGTPYIINGNYADGSMEISGSITPAQWNDPVSINFNFNPKESTIINPDNEDNGNVTDIPQALSIWDGHIVIDILDANGNSISDFPNAQPKSILLMSLSDWNNLTSSPITSTSIADNYTEYSLIDNWRIPSESEAILLHNTYISHKEEIDSLLHEAVGDPIITIDDKGNNIRYLCEGATKTYSFKDGNSYDRIRDAGTTVKTYRLRLVQTIPI